ncbi:cytochrome ubiquinol oxidase subunit I [Streptomyces hainanensis]|uniref:Cytochrome ubiquinol oxidase subunit I n=1 Tax=Streptomyces hainanensis TaxID=402648 RepID=A0A4V2Y3I8_9ACTN|nr:cytochrome ubiquinol oxidase subunit I [Streptomyces hainanensis]TDC76675.1 cytochrome ubiquinol oxidase subunit I [Streptomyces hainanensis]
MEAETLDLARWQFALTAGGHFLFVSLTLGLATVLAVLQTWATVRGTRDVHQRMVRFWGRLYVINYGVGIVTGILMEFQLGMAWSGLGHQAGDAFGASLALETVFAFFVEATFLALWLLGWDRFNRWVHLATLWVVTLTAYLSAYWILVANGFLNHPTGHVETADGRLELADPVALFTNPSTVLAFGHVVSGALLTAGVFLAGVSAYHLFRHRADEPDGFFARSLRIGIYTALPALFVTAAFGGTQLGALRTWQPAKIAAFEGDRAELDRVQAELSARFGPGDYLPHEALTRGAGLVMMIAFALLMLPLLASALLAPWSWAVRRLRIWHLTLMALVPLPFVAMIAGWVFREAGRQPWVVYGLLRTEDAVSQVSTGTMRLSLAVFVPLFALLVAGNWWLLLRAAGRGPSPADLRMS